MNIVVKSHFPARARVDIAASAVAGRVKSALKLFGRSLVYCSIAPLLPVILLMHLVALMESDRPA